MGVRKERVGALLQEDLGQILQKDYQNENMITVTGVRMTPDLSIAHIYVSIYAPGGDHNEAFEYINEHNAVIRKKLASRIRHQVRRIPELHFHFDDTSDYVSRMEELFQLARRQRGEGQTGEERTDEDEGQ